MVQVVEHLPSKHEAPTSIHSRAEKNLEGCYGYLAVEGR
jgi:hypothetical protein